MDIYIWNQPSGRGIEMLKRTANSIGEKVAVRAPGLQSIFYHGTVVLIVLILFQSFKETVSSVYYFNLVALGVTSSVGVLMIFIIPAFLGPFVKKLGWRTSFLILGAMTASSRLPMGLGLEQPFHLTFSSIALISSSMMLALVFAFHRREREVDPEVFSSQTLTASFALALMIMIMMRIAGRGLDVSIVPTAMGPTLSPGISGVISLGLGFMIYGIRHSPVLKEARKGYEVPGYPITGGAADSWAPIIGLGAFLFISTGILTDPHVITAWTGEDFTTAASFTVLSIGLFIFSLLSGMSWLMSLRRGFASPWGSILGNAILIAGAFNLFFLGMNIGIAPGAFTWICLVDLWLILDAMSDPEPFAGKPIEVERRDGTTKRIGFSLKKKGRTSPGHFGRALSILIGIGFLFVALISVSLNWSFLTFGILFKGGIPVMMMAGTLLLALCGFSCSKASLYEPAVILQNALKLDKGSPTVAAGEGAGHLRGLHGSSKRMRNLFITLGAFSMVLILLSGTATFLAYDIDVDESGLEAGDALTIATFNIHHGYSNDGRSDPTPHLEELKRIDPDIVFLQEADSLLLNEGNIDPGAFIAAGLGMHYFRGADPGMGNPGTAILSRFPLKGEKVWKLTSDGIQRIAVTCLADIGSMEIGLIGLHFGLEEEERERQFRDLFQIIDGMGNISMIIGGDLNTEPDDPLMAPLDPETFGNRVPLNVSSYSFKSGWHSTEKGMNDPDRPTYPAEGLDDDEEHIDYILFTADMEVLEAGIEPGRGASDHRPVWARARI